MLDAGIPGARNKWPDVTRDPRFVDFIRHFNGDRDYFECHELMEELWLEEGRHPLLQGLLQAAVGLHHWNNGNRSGAVKLMNQAQRKLQGYPEHVLGLDLNGLRDHLDRSLALLQAQPESAPFTAFSLKIVDPDLGESADHQV